MGAVELCSLGHRANKAERRLLRFNEQQVLADKLDNLLGLRASCPEFELEILVYDDCSADRTPEILGSYADRIDFLRGETRAGKSTGMNRLVERATGEVVIFTDANVMLSPELIRSFAGSSAILGVGVACSHLVYVNEETATASEDVVLAAGGDDQAAGVGDRFRDGGGRVRLCDPAAASRSGAAGCR